MMKLRRFMAVSLATVSMAASAVVPVDIRLWPEGAPTENGLEGTAEVYDEQRAMAGNVSDPVLTVFPAEKPNGTAIIMCPGGAYQSLAVLHEGTMMADWFNSMGVTYAVLKYRMPNGHDEVPLSDAEQAILLLRGNAGEWGVDPSSVGIMGASAGGHFASTLATHYGSKETRPDFQVLLYPVITMEEGITHGATRKNLIGDNPSEDMVRYYSNELQVTPETPKAFIVVSGDDGLVPVENSLRYYNALYGSGVSAALHVYPSGGHGWGFKDSFLYKPQWKEELEAWLTNEVFSPNSSPRCAHE